MIAQTDNAGSKIDSGKWTTWVYPWGEGVPQAEVPAGISLSLAAELLDQQELRRSCRYVCRYRRDG